MNHYDMLVAALTSAHGDPIDNPEGGIMWVHGQLCLESRSWPTGEFVAIEFGSTYVAMCPKMAYECAPLLLSWIEAAKR